ncbi:hypothetical protein [Actinoplanes sp. NPDC026670]|uniref:hypothetical protein n=1 Tax=Actinoplanes sp. NPDC026670 TaxID=3154700 RepID=UPI0033C5D24A
MALSDPDDLYTGFLHHPWQRQRRRPGCTVAAGLVRATEATDVRRLVLSAETCLLAGRFEQAGRACAAAWAMMGWLPVVEPELVATVLAVNAHLCVAARAPQAVQACRRYHAAAVDQYVAGDRRRLFYAQALNASLLAAVSPAAGADAFTRLLRRPGLTTEDVVVAEWALTAVRTPSVAVNAATRAALPPIPGGTLLAFTDSPDPDCLARLILAEAPAGVCRPAVASRRSS